MRGAYNLKWNSKTVKYLGVTLSKTLTDMFENNYSETEKSIQKDIQRWSTLPLDFSARIQTIKTNILLKLLYLIQALPINILQNKFITWDKMISRLIWNSQKTRNKN